MKKIIGIIFIILGLGVTICAGGQMMDNRKASYGLGDSFESTLESNFESAAHNLTRSEAKYKEGLFGVLGGLAVLLTGIILVSTSGKKQVIAITGNGQVQNLNTIPKTNSESKINYNTTHMKPKKKNIITVNPLTTNEVTDMYLNLKKITDLDLISNDELIQKKDSIKQQILTRGVSSNLDAFIVDLEGSIDGFLSKDELKEIYRSLTPNATTNTASSLESKESSKPKSKNNWESFETSISNSKLGNLIKRKFYKKRETGILKFIDNHGKLTNVILIIGIILISFVIASRPNEYHGNMLITDGPYVKNISKYTTFKDVSYDIFSDEPNIKSFMRESYIKSIKPGEMLRLSNTDNCSINISTCLHRDASPNLKLIRLIFIIAIFIIWIFRVSLFNNKTKSSNSINNK